MVYNKINSLFGFELSCHEPGGLYGSGWDTPEATPGEGVASEGPIAGSPVDPPA